MAGGIFLWEPSGPLAHESSNQGAGATYIDSYTLKGPQSFLDGYPAITAEGWVNVVIEIPAGTNAKWEVSKPDGLLRWEKKSGKPRLVKYLGYVGNYGMVPRTLLAKEDGGDGDPLDVLVLGPAVPRGSVIPVKIIGVLRLLDRGEQDDKLIAVPIHGATLTADSLKQLERDYPGILNIIEIWFTRYKGPGKMKSKGFGDSGEAQDILNRAVRTFKQNRH